MKALKKITISLLIVLISISCITSCSPKDPYDYKYPKYFDEEYIEENYEIFNPNLYYTKCYNRVKGKYQLYAIDNIDDLSYALYARTFNPLFGGLHSNTIVKKKDVPDPTNISNIDSIEIVYINTEYTSKLAYRELSKMWTNDAYSMTVTHQQIFNDLINVINRPTVVDLNSQEKPDNSLYTDGSFSPNHLILKVTYKEYDSLVALYKITCNDLGLYFLQYVYYVCGEGQEMDTLLDIDNVKNIEMYYEEVRLTPAVDVYINTFLKDVKAQEEAKKNQSTNTTDVTNTQN